MPGDALSTIWLRKGHVSVDPPVERSTGWAFRRTVVKVTPFRRWCVVALGTVVVVVTPFVLRALPTTDSYLSAARLLDNVRASQDLGWSGLVETDGALQLPDADRFSDVGALLGEQTRLRVWWRDADHWRVDQLLAAGETDLVNKGARTVEWDYEHAEATISRDPDIRLPRSADLVPPELAQRFLRGVEDGDVTRLPVRRVAGASAPGLRIVPSSELSSIEHLDLWSDPDSGVPLRVEVYAGANRPAFTSGFSRLLGRTARCRHAGVHPDTDHEGPHRRRARHR